MAVGPIEVVAEHAIGKRLSDLIAIPGTSRFLATDEAAHELLMLEAAANDLRVVARHICQSLSRFRATVSRWKTGDRRVALVAAADIFRPDQSK